MIKGKRMLFALTLSSLLTEMKLDLRKALKVTQLAAAMEVVKRLQ